MKALMHVCAAALLLLFGSQAALAQDCKPSKWGKDDEIGAANLVTPARVLQATKLVKQGKTHPLGIIIDSSTPAFPPRTLSLEVVQPGQQGGQRLFGYKGSYNDDLIQTWLGIGPQIDGLGHLGQDGLYYNCNNEKDDCDQADSTKNSLHRASLVHKSQTFGDSFRVFSSAIPPGLKRRTVARHTQPSAYG